MLQSVIERAASLGFAAKFGMEFEFFNFRETSRSLDEKGFRDLEPLTPGMFGYSIVRQAQNQPFFDALLAELRAFGVPLEGLHTETGPGVLEAAIRYTDALEAADRAQLFKSGAKEIGPASGSCRASWRGGTPTSPAAAATPTSRCGTSTASATCSRRRRRRRDEPALPVLPGRHPGAAPELHRAVRADRQQLQAAGRRLLGADHADVGLDNRTVAARVITGGGSGKATAAGAAAARFGREPVPLGGRRPGCGAVGHRAGPELEQPATIGSGYADESVERLPRNLQDATRRLADSTVVPELLGADFVRHFVETREWEWRQFQDAVTDWELKRYFEII